MNDAGDGRKGGELASVEGRLEGLLVEAERAGFDVRVRLETASECAWSCELAYTAEPNRPDRRPDRSHVVYAAGGADPFDVLARCLDELEAWCRDDVRRESGA